tara:strand:+ start:80 stop:640 length:561 start_codon:yes stop_codon:yes gene_type:complete
MQQINKVFGIGLSRTGTTSLHEAFKILGLHSYHYPQHFESILSSDAAVDVTVAMSYKILDVFFPGSKFVYTVRKIDNWVESMQKYFEATINQMDDEFANKVNRIVYDRTRFDEEDIEAFKVAFEKHHMDVISYFKDRSDDILILDIISGDGWEKLCPFLDRDIPNVPFPKTNTTNENWKMTQSIFG